MSEARSLAPKEQRTLQGMRETRGKPGAADATVVRAEDEHPQLRPAWGYPAHQLLIFTPGQLQGFTQTTALCAPSDGWGTSIVPGQL